MTEIELKLISDTEMHLFIEKGMKGGISYIVKRSSKQIINTCNFMIIEIHANILLNWMQIICIVGQ